LPDEDEKGGIALVRKLGKTEKRSSDSRLKRGAPEANLAPIYPIARSLSLQPVATQREAAPILTRFYMSPPANPGRSAYQSVSKSKNRLDSNFSVPPF
jgi:hypothetical protein